MTKMLTLAELEANVVAVVSEHRDAYPFLHWGGLATGGEVVRMGREEFDERRTQMTEPYGIGQVLRAAQFIAQAPRIASLNMKRSTYGWKHVAERAFRAGEVEGQPKQDYYIGEGSFLIAARAMGLTIMQRSSGAHYVNLSERAAKQGVPA